MKTLHPRAQLIRYCWSTSVYTPSKVFPFDSLISYGTFQWPEFGFTKHDRKRMETFINARAKQGLLTTGTWQQKQW